MRLNQARIESQETTYIHTRRKSLQQELAEGWCRMSLGSRGALRLIRAGNTEHHGARFKGPLRGVPAEKLCQSFGDKFFFAGLQHERVHLQAAFVCGQDDGWLAGAQLVRRVARLQGNVARVPVNFQVRNVIGDVRDGKRGADTRYACDFGGDAIEPAPPFFRQRIMIFLQVALQGFDHADDFFLADFLATAQRIFVRTVVEQRVSDQIFSADQQTRALRAANGFASAERNQVIAHICVIPQV